MRRLLAALIPLAVAVPVASAADTLELRDGRVLQGSYRGGTPEQLHFEIDGVLHGVPVTDVISLGFLGRRPGDLPAPAAQAAPASPRLARVGAGTRLRVRLTDALDPRQNTAGDRFQGALEMELQAAGQTIVASGSQVSGRIAGVDSGPGGGLSLELTALQIGDTSQAIVTGSQQGVAAGGNAPAAPAPSAGRIPAGTLLEFRLLQPFDVPLR
jgi:hypothetical protein